MCRASVRVGTGTGRYASLRTVTTVVATLAAGAARAETVAILQGLDKTTARISTIEAPLDRSVRFGALVVTARACLKRPPEEPPETAAFLEIDEIRPGGTSVNTTRVFNGWMFKSSPALSALENPVYDVGVLDCKEASGSPAASAGSSKTK